MVSGLSSALARAKELADKRRQAPSTAHLLIALFRGDESVRELCHAHGLSEVGLMGALAHVHDERTNAIDLALERARKLTSAMGMGEVNALHLLLAMAREPRSAASAELVRLGVQPEQLSQAALEVLQRGSRIPVPNAELDLRASRRGRDSRVEEPAAQQLSLQPRLLQRHRRFTSARTRSSLAEETESKLQRRTGLGSAPPPAPYAPGAEDSAASAEGEPRGSAQPAASAAAQVQPSRDLRSQPPSRAPEPPPGTASRTAPRLDDAPAASQPDSGVAIPKPLRSTRGRMPPPHARGGQAQRARPPTLAPITDSDCTLDPERFPLLCTLGRNLTRMAADGEIDPVIGRDADIQRVLDVLARRRGNNPVLVGPPGVGKTAIAQGVAVALLAGAREAGRQPRVLVEISTSSLLSGTGVRGALSERLQGLRREVMDADGRVLLFLDEIHTVLGGGEADSVGNELKAALARGELPMLGATTDAEYRRVFERDAALARRFTRIEVGEPSQADAVEMLRALAHHYEEHHRVSYDPDALAVAVELSVRYLPQRQLPDKAIALIDQAGARARRNGLPRVDRLGVASVVSELAAVPVDRLMMRDGEALLALEQRLQGRVVGQTAAISCIANALRKSAAGFRGARPLGTFLFLGPTGVGKTEMARAISEMLFPGVPWTRIDMSELGQAHAVARLIGSPPGYIGHDDGGQLTEAVRNRPYQLILLDEIEKAHMEVLMSLLPLLDEGRMTDGRGRTVDCTNTVIVMTSNLGADSASRGRIGFGGEAAQVSDAAQARAIAAVRAALPPELFNRIDEPLYFTPLTEADVAEIARRMLTGVAVIARERHAVELTIEDSAVEALIAGGGFDRVLGARPMRRTIGRLVEAPLASALLKGELVRGQRVVLRGRDGRVEIAPKSE